MGKRYVHELAWAVGALDADGLKDDPHRWLAKYELRFNGDRPPDRLPSDPEVDVWSEWLDWHPSLLGYFESRGLERADLRPRKIGYARAGEVRGAYASYGAFTFPVCEADELVNVIRRFHPEQPMNAKGKPVKYAGLYGRGAYLYPEPADSDCVYVVEGPPDALIMRKHGFHAVTSTHGTNWKPEWDAYVEGCQVAVIYDPEGFKLATQLAARLSRRGRVQGLHGRHGGRAPRTARTRAWAVDLSVAGLGPKEDVTDWFVKYGRTAAELRQLIRSARKDGSR
jgi:hypothetical protein